MSAFLGIGWIQKSAKSLVRLCQFRNKDGIMDVQLKDIIDKIKNDGVKSAQEEAARIIASARDEAAAMIQKAEEDAKRIQNDTEAEVQRIENNGKDALKQAGRDLILMIKEEIKSIFNRLLEREIRDALSVELLADVIVAAVRSISKQNEIDVLIPTELLSEIEPILMARLSAEIASGVEIRPYRGLDAGFRIAFKDGSAFYDFSDREIAAMLSCHLNSRLAGLLSA